MEEISIKEVSKISIIGGPGTGKSTLSTNLSRVLNIPNYHIDSFNYEDDWVKRDEKERDMMILDILNNEKWIIDGTYRSTLEERLKKSELVIFLDYNTFAKLKGIVLRYIRGKGKEKFDIPGCKEKLDFEFIKFTLKWNKNKRKDIFKYLNNVDKNKVLIFRRRKDLNKWYRNQFNTNIEIGGLKESEL